jgi:hypothetical protein
MRHPVACSRLPYFINANHTAAMLYSRYLHLHSYIRLLYRPEQKTIVTTFVFLKSCKIEGMDYYGQQDSYCR